MFLFLKNCNIVVILITWNKTHFLNTNLSFSAFAGYVFHVQGGNGNVTQSRACLQGQQRTARTCTGYTAARHRIILASYVCDEGTGKATKNPWRSYKDTEEKQSSFNWNILYTCNTEQVWPLIQVCMSQALSMWLLLVELVKYEVFFIFHTKM